METVHAKVVNGQVEWEEETEPVPAGTAWRLGNKGGQTVDATDPAVVEALLADGWALVATVNPATGTITSQADPAHVEALEREKAEWAAMSPEERERAAQILWSRTAAQLTRGRIATGLLPKPGHGGG